MCLTALKNSGFDQTLTYDEQDEPTRDCVNEESNQTNLFYECEDKCR